MTLASYCIQRIGSRSKHRRDSPLRRSPDKRQLCVGRADGEHRRRGLLKIGISHKGDYGVGEEQMVS
jgi:hypothetical protein